MHLLFLDESGQLSERKLFALGGIGIADRIVEGLFLGPSHLGCGKPRIRTDDA